jgi:hypothetical protein
MEHEFKVPREMELAKMRETARFELEDEFHCPICKGEYKLSEANGHPVRVCLPHRIVIPIKMN